MPHIIRDAEFKSYLGEGLWPGMWVHTAGWGHKHGEPSLLDACFLWRVEQHDGVMLLAGQGVDVLVPLTEELAGEVRLIKDEKCELLAEYPVEWAAIRKLGWGAYLHQFTTYSFRSHLCLYCQRGYKDERFFLPELPWGQYKHNPDAIRALLATSWWRIKHPKFASALARQQSTEFWDWPNVPDVKQLQAMGQAAYRTQEGSIEIGPDGALRATGRKAWGFPGAEEAAEED